MNYGFFPNYKNQMTNYRNMNNQYQLNQMPNPNLYQSPPTVQQFINQQQYQIINPIQGNQMNTTQKQIYQPANNIQQPIQSRMAQIPDSKLLNQAINFNNEPSNNIQIKNINKPTTIEKDSSNKDNQNNLKSKPFQQLMLQKKTEIDLKKYEDNKSSLTRQVSDKTIKQTFDPQNIFPERNSSNPNIPNKIPNKIQKMNEIQYNQVVGISNNIQNIKNVNIN